MRRMTTADAIAACRAEAMKHMGETREALEICADRAEVEMNIRVRLQPGGDFYSPREVADALEKALNGGMS